MASIPMSLTCDGAQQTAGSRQDKKSLKSWSYDPHFLFWHLRRTLAPLWAVLCGSVIAISTHTTKKKNQGSHTDGARWQHVVLSSKADGSHHPSNDPNVFNLSTVCLAQRQKRQQGHLPGGAEANPNPFLEKRAAPLGPRGHLSGAD